MLAFGVLQGVSTCSTARWRSLGRGWPIMVAAGDHRARGRRVGGIALVALFMAL